MKNLSHHIHNNTFGLQWLEKKTGISIKRLEKIAELSNSVTYSELRAIAEAFNLPISHLIQEYIQKPQFDVIYRKQFGSAADSETISNFNFYVENILSLKPDFKKVIDYKTFIKPVENNYQNAEALANYFRQTFFDGNYFDALIDLPELLSNELNFIVKVLELGKNSDGASACLEGLVFIIISPRFEGRMLYTVAHELAHVFNHHEQGDYVYFDKNIHLQLNDDKFKVEAFANTFASCLLLPQPGVVKIIEKVRELYQLTESPTISDIEILYVARFYGVSFEVAASRCETLGLIPKGGARALAQKLKNDFNSPEKRADDLDIVARQPIEFPYAPSFILDRAINLIDSGDLSIGKASEILLTPINEILKYHKELE